MSNRDDKSERSEGVVSLEALVGGLRGIGSMPPQPALSEADLSEDSGDGSATSPVPPHISPTTESPVPELRTLVNSLHARGAVPMAPALSDAEDSESSEDDAPPVAATFANTGGWQSLLRHPGLWAGLSLAAALLLVVLVGPGQQTTVEDNPITARGDPEQSVQLDLRIVVERSGQILRLADGAPAHIGEKIYFRARVLPATDLLLTVDGPEGPSSLAEVAATAEGVDVPADGGLLAYVFTTSGTHTFSLRHPATDTTHSLLVEVR